MRKILMVICIVTIILFHPITVNADYDVMHDNTVRIITLKNNAGSTGSGFVIGGGNYCVTNWHVVNEVERGAKVGIITGKDNIIDGKVIWHSEIKDLAVIQLSKNSGRPSVVFATKDKVKSGQTIYIYGYPGALDSSEKRSDIANAEPTVTRGVLSRVIRLEHNNVTYYQTDAAVNPGNSGGPMFNEQGQVIGIIAMRLESSGAKNVAGIGWAIQCEELLSELSALNIQYQISGTAIKDKQSEPSDTSKNDSNKEDPKGKSDSQKTPLYMKVLKTGGYIAVGLVIIVLSVLGLKNLSR